MIKTAYRWDANWKITILFLLLLPLLLSLGFWQLSRAEEKQRLQQSIEQQQALPALTWRELLELEVEQLSYRQVKLSGRYDNARLFLLDNQVVNGKVGYQVLQPFILSSGQTPGQVLVNRGWVAGFADRRLPVIPVNTEIGDIVATVRVPSSEPVLLAEDNWVESWPKVIQSVDMGKIRSQFGNSLFEYELRLEPHQWSALTIDWPAVNTRPEKHTGYAIQWFAMAAALIVCWLYASISKTHRKLDSNQEFDNE